MSYYGAIDEGMVARKYEETGMYENPSLVNDMQRGTLQDFRPDQAVFESDLTRRDYQSSSRIRLRESGSRGDNPEHPEIFIGFTDRDPRGAMLDPDYKQLTNQAWARRRFIEAKMYNDDDHSVPSQGIHPAKMQHLIKHSYGDFKSRYKNFSTSKDALKPGMHPVSTRTGSEVDKLYAKSERMDNLVPDGVEFTQGKTVALSNNTNIGWWQTSDHEFKVAQYGRLYAQPGRQREGISRDTRYEAEFSASKQRKPSKPMVMLMSAAVSNKKDKHVGGDMEFQTGHDGMTRRAKQAVSSSELMEMMHNALIQIKYGNSEESRKGKNRTVEDLNKIREFVEATQKLPSHTQIAIKEELARFTARNPRPHDIHPDRSMVVINPKIIEFMDQMVRKNGKEVSEKLGSRRADDVAGADITIQTEKNGPSINGVPIFMRKRNNKKVAGASHSAFASVKGESKKTHSYRNAKPDIFSNVQDQATVDLLIKSSAVNMKRAELMQARDMVTRRSDLQEDNDFGENRGMERRGRPMGSKYMTREMQMDHNETDLNDIV